VAIVYRAANQHELGRMEICDRFWPYLKPAAISQEDPEQALYVARVRGFFLEPACVSAVFSAADEKLAAEWYRAGIPLDQVQRAILMGCARKYVTLFNDPVDRRLPACNTSPPLFKRSQHWTRHSITGAIWPRERARWKASGGLKQTLREQPPQQTQKRTNVALTRI